MPKWEFNAEYKLKCFEVWYSGGKPGHNRLFEMLPESDTGAKPTALTLTNWIQEYKQTAIQIDAEVEKELQVRMVKEKVEMLSRHAKTGKEMQDMGMTYLQGHEKELNANVAVRMLVEGIAIERASRGVSSALEKMLNMSDEQLQEEVLQLLSGVDNTVKFEANE
jgi:hypothetical protein